MSRLTVAGIGPGEADYILPAVIEKMKKFGLKPDVVYKAARSVDVPKVILDNHKIAHIHEFKIRSFDEGLKLYIDYLRK